MNWLTPKAQARSAGDKGWGSFAIEPISKGETVGSFGGWSIPREVLATLELERQHRAIQVDDDQYLVSQESREPGDCFNHSCEPSCGLMGATVLKARRDIAVGEELTFDYAMCDSSQYDEFICACGKSNCREKITGCDWQKEDLQREYKNHFGSYIEELIKLSHPK
jgi:SET domain-containing protein